VTLPAATVLQRRYELGVVLGRGASATTYTAIDRVLGSYLCAAGVTSFAVSETQKFGHVTYFWNGNNSEKFDESLEDWVEIPSSRQPFDQQPQMMAREVCDVVVRDLRTKSHRFVRANFANGDMVGHTGSLTAAVTAVEVVDECVGKILHAVGEAGATLLVTADHGNSDLMWEVDRKTGEVKRDAEGRPKIKTSHTLSPVPLWLVGEGVEGLIANPAVADPGLGNIAATILFLLGFQAPADYLPALVAPGK